MGLLGSQACIEEQDALSCNRLNVSAVFIAGVSAADPRPIRGPYAAYTQWGAVGCRRYVT